MHPMHLWDEEFKVIAIVSLAYLWHLEICIFYVDLKLCSVRDCYTIKTKGEF